MCFIVNCFKDFSIIFSVKNQFTKNNTEMYVKTFVQKRSFCHGFVIRNQC
jgi:hypothetical protein